MDRKEVSRKLDESKEPLPLSLIMCRQLKNGETSVDKIIASKHSLTLKWLWREIGG